MPIRIHDIEQGTEAWLKIRLGKITGTTVKILLTKGRKHASNGSSDFTGNFHTKRGHILEKSAIKLYEDINNVDTLEVGFVTNTDYPGCGYSPDGVLGDKLLEVKCFAEKRHKLASSTIPFEILAQVHFGMMICDLPATDVIFYNPDLPVEDCLVIKTIERDLRIENNITKRLVENHAGTTLG